MTLWVGMELEMGSCLQARRLRPSLWVSGARESVGRSRRRPRQGDASSILIWRMQPTVNKVHSLQRPSISSGSSMSQQHPSPHRQQVLLLSTCELCELCARLEDVHVHILVTVLDCEELGQRDCKLPARLQKRSLVHKQRRPGRAATIRFSGDD